MIDGVCVSGGGEGGRERRRGVFSEDQLRCVGDADDGGDGGDDDIRNFRRRTWCPGSDGCGGASFFFFFPEKQFVLSAIL